MKKYIGLACAASFFILISAQVPFANNATKSSTQQDVEVQKIEMTKDLEVSSQDPSEVMDLDGEA